jgi:hypothetical protein
VIRKVALLAALCVIAACDPEGFLDSNSATLRFTVGEDDIELQHDPFLSTLSLSPPAAGVVELFFLHDDPAAEMTLRVDSEIVAAGEVVELPSDGVEISAAFAGQGFDGGEQGNVELVILDVDEELGEAALNAVLDVSVAGEEADLTISGFVDAVSF